MRYLALLRGINVGGKNIIPMADLRQCFEQAGLVNVQTFIQTGNIFFDSDKSAQSLANEIPTILKARYSSEIAAVLFTKDQWAKIIADAPTDWGKDSEWKHNLLIMIPPFSMSEVVASIGVLKPDIEFLVAGDGVLYQSMSRALYGRTTTGKLASSPVYKQMTIRNYNTATKLLALF